MTTTTQSTALAASGFLLKHVSPEYLVATVRLDLAS
jgi:hypothetical protein